MLFLLPFKGPVTIEILGILYLNLTSLIYISANWSLKTRLHNQLDQFDEYWICVLSFHLVYFTDYTLDSDVAFGYGWLMIVLMLINIFVKSVFILE